MTYDPIGDLLGGPVVKNSPCNAGDMNSIPGQGTKVSHAATKSQCSQIHKKKKKKKKNWDFPGGSDGKVSAYNVGDLGSIPGSGRSPGEGNGNPLQFSCLENPMDRGTW